MNLKLFRILERLGKLVTDKRDPTWPPRFCPKCDRRMKQLEGDPDIYVCDDEGKRGGCGLYLRRPGTGRQPSPSLPNQGDYRGEL